MPEVVTASLKVVVWSTCFRLHLVDKPSAQPHATPGFLGALASRMALTLDVIWRVKKYLLPNVAGLVEEVFAPS